MAICAKCGYKVRKAELDQDGVCEDCRAVAEAEKKAAELRGSNYRLCLEKRAAPHIQRTYDAFVAKYPSALIDGVSVTNSDERVLFHLDGKPAYFATFNPLTGDVDLVKYADAVRQAEAAEISEAQQLAAAKRQSSRDTRSGFIIAFAIFGALYGAFCLYGSVTLVGMIGLVCSLLVLVGGICQHKALILLGGVLSFAAVAFGGLGVPYFIFALLIIAFGAGF